MHRYSPRYGLVHRRAKSGADGQTDGHAAYQQRVSRELKIIKPLFEYFYIPSIDINALISLSLTLILFTLRNDLLHLS